MAKDLHQDSDPEIMDHFSLLEEGNTLDLACDDDTKHLTYTQHALSGHPRYEILGRISRTKMAEVYKGRHRALERLVAIKVINGKLVNSFKAIERFHREVRLVAQLSHRNIVRAHDAEQDKNLHLLIMEYVDGIDLARLVGKLARNQTRMPVHEACDYIRQAACGLQYAHEKNLVHRDIKPNNLMVTVEGVVKVLDFGIASLLPMSDFETDVTPAESVVGTPDFISPEQASLLVDVRMDIYSLGATFYFLLAGHVPFPGGDVTDKLLRHARQTPRPIREIRPDVPAKLAAVLEKMLDKDPEQRYQTAAEVSLAITRAMERWWWPL